MMETFFFVAIVVIEIVVLKIRNDVKSSYDVVDQVDQAEERYSNCVFNLSKDVFAEGTERITINGYRYCAFTGIPYARPPIQNYRFELPVKIPFWKGKKRFNQEADVCVQMSYETFEVMGSEDCLLLNIYTINRQKITTSSSNLMPVLFWIHGGSYNIGSSSSDLNKPDYIIEKEIVVVTMNYRLGTFGFLSYSNVTRNIGLHDQRMALEWVHDNIIYFGGNKSRITLSGWSAGGASVSYHMYAIKSKDLFDKAIMMSGNMLNPWAFESDVIACTNGLLAKLNIRNDTHAIEQLKAVDAYDLIPPTFSDELKINFFGSEQFCFVPTIDDDFVPQPPHIHFHQQTPSNISIGILIGTTSLESEWPISLEASNYKYPNRNLNTSDSIHKFLSQIFEDDFDNPDIDRFIRNFQLASDISYGIYKFIQNYVASTKEENVFVYRFAFDDKFSDSNESYRIIGAGHGDELKYLFKDDLLENVGNRVNLWNKMIVTQRMVTMWTNFIKFGNPTPIADLLLTGVIWYPFSTEERLLLNIDDDMTIKPLSDNDGAFQLWDCIYQCLYYSECDELNEYLLNNKLIEF